MNSRNESLEEETRKCLLDCLGWGVVVWNHELPTSEAIRFLERSWVLAQEKKSGERRVDSRTLKQEKCGGVVRRRMPERLEIRGVACHSQPMHKSIGEPMLHPRTLKAPADQLCSCFGGPCDSSVWRSRTAHDRFLRCDGNRKDDTRRHTAVRSTPRAVGFCPLSTARFTVFCFYSCNTRLEMQCFAPKVPQRELEVPADTFYSPITLKFEALHQPDLEREILVERCVCEEEDLVQWISPTILPCNAMSAYKKKVSLRARGSAH